ncbi:hypothetical protein Y032_0009g792 [Ancylostoma ceylanicum]|nr:hypothetical protein Y032_0009g792 [Ancylostoma ceylanicum]
MSTLAPKSKLHFEGFKGLEPLRDGDDVNLNSEECEDLKGKDALEQPGKDKGKPPPVGGAGAQPSKPPTSKETTTGSKSKSDASGKKSAFIRLDKAYWIRALVFFLDLYYFLGPYPIYFNQSDKHALADMLQRIRESAIQ